MVVPVQAESTCWELRGARQRRQRNGAEVDTETRTAELLGTLECICRPRKQEQCHREGQSPGLGISSIGLFRFVVTGVLLHELRRILAAVRFHSA